MFQLFINVESAIGRFALYSREIYVQEKLNKTLKNNEEYKNVK